MRRYLLDTLKLLVLLVTSILLFYFGLKAFHEEYERYHRYDEPEGQTVKVFLENHSVFHYLDRFFR